MAKTESVNETTTDPAIDPAIDPAAPVYPTEAELRGMLVLVEGSNSDLHRPALIQTLTEQYGLAIGKTEEWGVPFIRLLGIEALSTTDDPATLLSVWCMRARQAIMAGDVAPEPEADQDGEAPLFRSERAGA